MHEAGQEALAHKRAAFVGFLDEYYAFTNALSARGSARANGDSLVEMERELREAYGRLFTSRNRLTLVSAAYTYYYVDQMMGDAERALNARLSGEEVSPRFPDAGHRVFYLMRAEIAGVNLDSLPPDGLLAEMNQHSARQGSIAEALREYKE